MRFKKSHKIGVASACLTFGSCLTLWSLYYIMAPREALRERNRGGLENFGVTAIDRDVTPPPKWHGTCNVIYPHPAPQGRFNCPRLSLAPHPMICVRPGEHSDVIQQLYAGSLHDKQRLRLFQAQLLQDPDVHVIDLNSLYGTFGVLAAKMNCSVVFVQSNLTHLDMVITSMLAMGLRARGKGMFLGNIIHKHSQQSPQPVTKGNDGRAHTQAPAILLDDLLEVTSFQKAVLVMDLGLNDAYTMHSSQEIFSSIQILFIFMKFKPEVTVKNIDRFHDMFRVLSKRGFHLYSLSGNLISSKDMRQWPNEVVWKSVGAEFVPLHYLIEE